ncbi:Ypt/Rab GTPase activating protein [Phaffia rhodozyma]|uniref:Ypt/Rab GTPase activating protein n=1 Tax=Phaffia rhodozyma TaxID=264483 RepID=A0A0F7SLV2_PHARH|nr:Ypt/Rab GTPase activating protein [Phaffia rhodozyma]
MEPDEVGATTGSLPIEALPLHHPLSLVPSIRPNYKSKRVQSSYPQDVNGYGRSDSSTAGPASYFDLKKQTEELSQSLQPVLLTARHSAFGFPSPSPSDDTTPSWNNFISTSAATAPSSQPSSPGFYSHMPLRSPGSFPSQSSLAHRPSIPSKPSTLSQRRPKEDKDPLVVSINQSPLSHPSSSTPDLARSIDPISSSMATRPSSSSTSRIPSILSREEEEVLNARYDLMADDELTNALVIWESSFNQDGQASLPTGFKGGNEKPLFPPSPTDKEHPMKVLARIGWRLWKLEVQRAEKETRARPQGGPIKAMDDDQYDSLHYDLHEALSTSLSTSPLTYLETPTRSSSLPPLNDSIEPVKKLSTETVSLPPTRSRTKPRGNSISTLASFTSILSAPSSSSESPHSVPNRSVSRGRKHNIGESTPTKSNTTMHSTDQRSSSPTSMKKHSRKRAQSTFSEWLGIGSMWSRPAKERDRPGSGSITDKQSSSSEGQSTRKKAAPSSVSSKGSMKGYLSPLDRSPPLNSDSRSGFLEESSSTSDETTPGEQPYRVIPSHFRALFLSTRLLSTEAASLFSDPHSVSPLISHLAFELVSNARNQGITVSEQRRPSNQTTRSRRESSVPSNFSPFIPPSQPSTLVVKDKGTSISSGQPLVAASSMLSRALSSAAYPYPSKTSAKSIPSTGFFASSADKNHSTNRSSNPYSLTAEGPVTRVKTGTSPNVPSVELEAIEPTELRPPTLLSNRSELRLFLHASRKNSKKKRSGTASRFDTGLEPLTDRYGFIYDVRNINMLREASEAGAPAPACFAGLPATAPNAEPEEEDDWVEQNIRVKNSSPSRPISEKDLATLSFNKDSSTVSAASGVSVVSTGTEPDITMSPTFSKPSAGAKGKHKSHTSVSLNPSPVRAVNGSQKLHVKADVPQVDGSSAPRQGLHLTGRKTIQLLLNQQKTVHEQQQANQTAAWDAYLRRRRESSSMAAGKGDDTKWTEIGFAQMGNHGKTGKEERKEFAKLVRGGIPIAYRPKIWMECSGAQEVMAPGDYNDLLTQAEKEGVDSTVLAEIEKDVVRTLPLNVFFGGDGPGVAKLRRLLTAYAWHNMSVGYCQGMNMLAATLLLVYQREEEAFWVFLCMVERLMPPDYYSPSLLCSRADQRVLQDLLKQELPQLDIHLTELGVEVAAVSFGWFLSLFTDCLPVETLFRVWDVFFVEGFDFFFRCALAVLKANQTTLLQCNSIGTLYQSLEACTSRLWNADQLLSIEMDFKTTATQSYIVSRRAVHVSDLLEESGGLLPL